MIRQIVKNPSNKKINLSKYCCYHVTFNIETYLYKKYLKAASSDFILINIAANCNYIHNIMKIKIRNKYES